VVGAALAREAAWSPCSWQSGRGAALDDLAAAAASTLQGFEPMRNMISPCRYPLLLHPRRYSLLAFDCMCSGIMFGISQSFRTCSDRTISMTLPVVLTLLHMVLQMVLLAMYGGGMFKRGAFLSLACSHMMVCNGSWCSFMTVTVFSVCTACTQQMCDRFVTRVRGVRTVHGLSIMMVRSGPTSFGWCILSI
jgi:hypothetical protein